MPDHSTMCQIRGELFIADVFHLLKNDIMFHCTY